MKQRHLFGSRARASLPGCVDSQHGSLSSRSATPSESFQVASKELESSQQQLVGEASSYGSGKHREFLFTVVARCREPEVASPVVQKCRMLQESQAQTEASSLREEVGTQLLACSATQVLEM